MFPILLKSASFLFLIALGYLLKRVGFFGPLDYKIPAKLVANITMPCAALISFATYTPDFSLLILVLLGFGMNCVMLLVGFLLSRNQPRSIRAVWLNCTPSYNIGAFAMPFIQSFLPPASLVGTCLFDVGSAMMCNGTTFAISKNILDKTKGINLKLIGGTLLRSVPFLSYMLFLLITLFRIPIPQKVVDFATPMANANAFLAMIMVGMMLDLTLDKSLLKNAIGIVAVRYISAILVALAVYFLLPLPLNIRQAVAITAFAPVGMISTAYAPQAGGDPGIAACANSLSILLCIPSVLVLLVIFGVM